MLLNVALLFSHKNTIYALADCMVDLKGLNIWKYVTHISPKKIIYVNNTQS